MTALTPTPGEWIAWKLDPNSDTEERFIITTAVGEIELTGIIENEADARLMAASKTMADALQFALPYLRAAVANPRDSINPVNGIDRNCVDRCHQALVKVGLSA